MDRIGRGSAWGVGIGGGGGLHEGGLPGWGLLGGDLHFHCIVNKMTDMCKNITFPILHMRTVIIITPSGQLHGSLDSIGFKLHSN